MASKNKNNRGTTNNSAGTSGNRSGYKVFSINTTVRNPKRNLEFLEMFVPFSGKPFDSSAKEEYLFECVKRGIYRFNNVDEMVKYKLQNDIELSTQEVKQAFKDNPQATGFSNRVVTQLRSLKDQGFLDFAKDAKSGGAAIYNITFLGKALLDNIVSSNDIYTISMIGLHGKSPIRPAVYNETRPFLNTLFVMDEVKHLLEKKGKEFKGILLHEFAAFVLSMKDCNYKNAALEIIKYREKFHNSINKEYIENYIYNIQGLLKISFDTLTIDYVDDVYRKFEMTGLLRKHGFYQNTYIDFSSQNYGKVKQILENFSGYYWHDFSSKKEYYNFIENIELPWNADEVNRLKVLQEKADFLGADISNLKLLDDIEKYLNDICSKTAIAKQVEKFSFEEISKELLILSKDVDSEPSEKVRDLSQALRLEYLLALLFAKKYGADCVISNLIYNDDGEPLSFAPGGQSDISFHSKDLNLIIEATMIKNKNQQINSETSNVSRHLQNLKTRSGIDFGLTLVAPYIHRDTCDYFEYTASRKHQKVCPLTIPRVVEIAQISETPLIFGNNFSIVVEALKDSTEHPLTFVDFINSKYLSFLTEPNLYSDTYLKALYTIMVKSESSKGFIRFTN